MARPRHLAVVVLAACAAAEPPAETCGPDAPSTCLRPTRDAAYYAEQGRLYFDTLDATADPDSGPAYHPDVLRWEWPPWLLLTGMGSELIEAVDDLVLVAQPDNTVPDRDCRGFDVQPFGRCRVVMQIEGRPCPIYEEFTFDADGRVTFVEAWSDLPDLGPVDLAADPWAEDAGAHRLSTRVPGLGGGGFDPDGRATAAAAADDPELADVVARTRDFWGTWAEAYAAGDDLYERGCGW